MVKSKQLVKEYRKQFGKTYEQMDCIHSIANIIHRYGGKSDLTGSNWWARYEIKNLRPLTSKDQLYDGAAVLKTVHPGERGYALPARYKNHAIQIDYNHIGLGTDEGQILDSTRTASGRDGPGVSTAGIGPNSWDVIGDFEDVDYSDRGTGTVVVDITDPLPEISEMAMVVAESGGTVNLRKLPSQKAVVLEYVKIGAHVAIIKEEKAWSKIMSGTGKTGWMMNKFLHKVWSEDSVPGDQELSLEEKVDILWAAYQRTAS